MNFRKISRKIFIVRIIISVILLLVLAGFGIYFLIWDLSGQHHFHEEPENMLTGFTSEEQTEILDAFGLTIPENEKNAYVYSFAYSVIDERFYSYTVEIGGVEDYEGFYAANPQRRSFNETTSNFRTDRHYYIVYTDSGGSTFRYNNLYNKLCDR